MPDETPLIEPIAVADVFISGIARIEKLAGGCLRFVLYAEQHEKTGSTERVVAAKFIIPAENVPEAVRQALSAIHGSPLIAADGTLKLLN